MKIIPPSGADRPNHLKGETMSTLPSDYLMLRPPPHPKPAYCPAKHREALAKEWDTRTLRGLFASEPNPYRPLPKTELDHVAEAPSKYDGPKELAERARAFERQRKNRQR